MARARRDAGAEVPAADVSVVTDAKAEAPEETPAADAPAEEAPAGNADGGEDDGVVQTDGGGRTLVEVVTGGAIVRVGGHPLMLTRGSRARVTAETAERPAFRRL